MHVRRRATVHAVCASWGPSGFVCFVVVFLQRVKGVVRAACLAASSVVACCCVACRVETPFFRQRWGVPCFSKHGEASASSAFSISHLCCAALVFCCCCLALHHDMCESFTAVVVAPVSVSPCARCARVDGDSACAGRSSMQCEDLACGTRFLVCVCRKKYTLCESNQWYRGTRCASFFLERNTSVMGNENKLRVIERSIRRGGTTWLALYFTRKWE